MPEIVIMDEIIKQEQPFEVYHLLLGESDYLKQQILTDRPNSHSYQLSNGHIAFYVGTPENDSQIEEAAEKLYDSNE